MATEWGPSLAKRASKLKDDYSSVAVRNARDRATGAGPPAATQMMLKVGRLARPEPHQQTPEQFANDSRTWWHGRYAAAGVTGKGGARLTKTGTDEGFHAGSKGAAVKRLEQNYGRWRGEGGQHAPGRLYPLRLVGPMGLHPNAGAPESANVLRRTGETPFAPAPDENRHRSLGSAGKGYFYKNAIEDPGHISVGVPKREGYLTTHLDTIKAAQERGEYVHPAIAWAAKQHDHTGQDVMQHRQYRMDRPSQGSFAQALHEMPVDQFAGHPSGRSASDQRWHESQSFNTGRISSIPRDYTTEGGQMVRATLYPNNNWRREF